MNNIVQWDTQRDNKDEGENNAQPPGQNGEECARIQPPDNTKKNPYMGPPPFDPRKG